MTTKKEAGIVRQICLHCYARREIKENDYNLNIPRYVDTYEEEEAEMNLTSTAKKIEQLQGRLADITKQMDEYLKIVLKLKKLYVHQTKIRRRANKQCKQETTNLCTF